MIEIQEIVTNITRRSDGSYKIFVTNWEAAKKINRKLRQYKKDSGALHTFQDGEEAIFVVPENHIVFCKKVLKEYDCLG